MSRTYVHVNRESWDLDAPNWVERGRVAWAREEPVWARGHTESEPSLLVDVDGLDTIDLGCGTAYISAWLMRRGANVAGLDTSFEQLATAQMLQEEFDLRFPLVHADAEHAPFADGSFDFATSEYVPRSGATRTGGSPRRHGSSGEGAGSCSRRSVRW